MPVLPVILLVLWSLLLPPASLGQKNAVHLKEYVRQSSKVQSTLPSSWDGSAPQGLCPLNLLFRISAHKNLQLLCLKSVHPSLDRNPLVSPASQVVVYGGTMSKSFSLGATTASEMVEGFVSGETDSSAAGFLHEGFFYGRIHLGEGTYAVEPAQLYHLKNKPSNNPGNWKEANAVIYCESDLELPTELFNQSRDMEVTLKTTSENIPDENEVDSKEPPADPITLDFYRGTSFNPSRIFAKKRNFAVLCSVCVVADHHFFKIMGKSSVELTLKRLLFLVSEAETLFRIADFDEDGVPDNIGLYIAEVRIYTTLESEGNGMKPTYKSAHDYLQDFSFGHYDDFCLGLAVTDLRFEDAVLGLAWRAKPRKTDQDSGGICSKRDFRKTEEPHHKSYNTLVVTMRGSKGFLGTQTAVLNLVHEIGHAFGSKHDKDECLPGSKDPSGRYLMSPFSQNGKKLHHRFFSPCSKEYIRNVLVHNADCFLPIAEAYCGNGIVEEGEECECGVMYHSCKEQCCGRRQGPHACKSLVFLGCVPASGTVTTLKSFPLLLQFLLFLISQFVRVM